MLSGKKLDSFSHDLCLIDHFISVADKHCTSEEFKSTLLMEFPKLKDGGGFELLRPYGATRTKTLQVIPCPSEGYTPHYLQDTIGIHAAIVYIRPLQKDRDMVCNLKGHKHAVN